MPGLHSETFGTTDQRWLGSTHGMYNAQSCNLDISAFTKATHFPDGYLMSGIPLAKLDATDKYVPYVTGGTGGAQKHAGFLLTDRAVDGSGEDINGAVLLHGIINVDHLPVSGFTPPTGGSFTYRGAGV